MIIAHILVTIALAANPTVPDGKDYWQGYASSVIAGQVIKPAVADIHEGKPKPTPKPKDADVGKPVAVPVPVEPVPQAPVKSEPAPTPFAIDPDVLKNAFGMGNVNLNITPAPELPKVEPKKEEAPKAKQPWEVPPYPLPPAPVPTEGKKVAPAPAPEKPKETPKPVVKETPKPLPLPTTYLDTIAYAKQRGCVVLLVFGTPDCPKCEDFKETTKDKDVRAALVAKHVGLIQKIDCTIEPQIADYLKIKSVPAYCLTDGKSIKTIGVGYLPPQEFIDWLKAQ